MKKAIFITFLLLFTILLLQSIFGAIQHFFRNNTPSAQAVRLEQVYKDIYDNAEKARQDADTLIVRIQHDSSSSSTTFQQYDEKMQAYFADRNAQLSAMIAQDKQAESSMGPTNYKQFYVKRLLADTTNDTSFRAYSKGILSALDSVLSYMQYNEAYTNTVAAFSHMDAVHGPTIAELEAFKGALQEFNTTYTQVTALSETTDIYPQSLLSYFDEEHTVIEQVSKIVSTLENKDMKAYTQLSYETYAQIQQSPNVKNLLLEWRSDKLEPLLTQSSSQSQTTNVQYQQAYYYAKNQKFAEVLAVWGQNVPGKNP